MDCKWILAFLPYGGRWRKGRKLLHNYLHIGVASTFNPVQITAARRLVANLLSQQEHPSSSTLLTAVRLDVGQRIMKIVYGLDVKDAGSEFISIPEQLNLFLGECVIPGKFLVDLVPASKPWVAILYLSETKINPSFVQYDMFQPGCLVPDSMSSAERLLSSVGGSGMRQLRWSKPAWSVSVSLIASVEWLVLINTLSIG
jgi:hypothetical protein